MEVVNTRDQVYRRKTETRSMRTRSFVKENPKAGDINYGMIAHGNDKGAETRLSMMLSPAYAIVTVLS